jgi:ferric-dicitrate binding protein FerR (iron transport regulator)
MHKYENRHLHEAIEFEGLSRAYLARVIVNVSDAYSLQQKVFARLLLTGRSPQSVVRPPLTCWARFPVIVILLCCIAGWGFRDDSRHYETQIGKSKVIRLPDQSVMTLNTNSAADVHYTAQRREITLLRGEALFAVAHNPERPFDVEVGARTVSAVGTKFAVRLRAPEYFDVFVREGRIAILGSDSRALDTPQGETPAGETINAGQAATVSAGEVRVTNPGIEGIDAKLSWTKMRLSFQGETLTEVVAEFNRFNRTQLVIIDPTLGGMQIGGEFAATEPERFVAVLRLLGIERVAPEISASGVSIIYLDRREP